MNKYIQEALLDYDSAKRELEKFTKENTDFELSLDDGGYPLTFTFTPSVDHVGVIQIRADELRAIRVCADVLQLLADDPGRRVFSKLRLLSLDLCKAFTHCSRTSRP